MARARRPADERGRAGAPAVRRPPARLAAAAARHDELLAAIARRRGVRDRLAEDARAAVAEVGARMAALAAQARALDQELHGLLQAVVADPRRPPRQRADLERIYAELEGDVITPRAPRGVRVEAPRPAAPPPAPDARPADRGPLRALFRRLADALHPDKVQDDDERARRTEVMKQITVAYADGDYARLVTIERTWSEAIAARADEGTDEVERRILAKERAVAELEAQLAALEREIRALRASDGAELVRELRRADGAPLAEEREAAHGLARMRAVRDFVAAFHAGAITFERFCEGPPAAGDAGALAELDVDLRGGPPGDVARVIADLERLARSEGVRVEDLLRAVQAAAHGAGVGPRRRR